ncbi:MAG: hypothetical protein OEV44_11740 [Spirochaetota bacterium]|nr:hypothetical protein [Spirochaetota bacterium]
MLVNKIFKLFAFIILLLIIPKILLADVSDAMTAIIKVIHPIIWHFFVGNFIIGSIKGKIIERYFGNENVLFAVWKSIFASFTSFFIVLILMPLITLGYIFFIILSLIVIIFTEWPFYYWMIESKNNRKSLSFKASLLAQGLTYHLIVLYYYIFYYIT